MRAFVAWLSGRLACWAGEHDTTFRQEFLSRHDGEKYGIRQTWYCRRCGEIAHEHTELWN